MLVELSVIPLGVGEHLSGSLAELLKIIHVSGVPYKLTPSGTCLEGDWNQVMDVIKQCHTKARETSRHVFTSIRIEDEEGADDKLARNIFAIEQKVGHELSR